MIAWTAYVEYTISWRNMEFKALRKMGDINNPITVFKAVRMKATKTGAKQKKVLTNLVMAQREYSEFRKNTRFAHPRLQEYEEPHYHYNYVKTFTPKKMEERTNLVKAFQMAVIKGLKTDSKNYWNLFDNWRHFES